MLTNGQQVIVYLNVLNTNKIAFPVDLVNAACHCSLQATMCLVETIRKRL